MTFAPFGAQAAGRRHAAAEAGASIGEDGHNIGGRQARQGSGG